MTAAKPASKKHRRQDSPTMDVTATVKKSPPPTPPSVNKKPEKKECFRLEEYPEDIGKLIKQLAAQEAIVKAKEKAVLKWSKNLATAKKAYETEHVAETGKRQKEQDGATKAKETKRQQEIKKWQKVKDNAAAKKKAKYTKDQATWLEILQNAHSKMQITTAEKMLRELEANKNVPSKEMKKADKMLNQLLAKEGTESSTTSDKKQGKKKLLRTKNCNVPSNEERRAQKKLNQLEDDLYVVKGQVAVTKKMIRLAAEEKGLKNIPGVEEEKEEQPVDVPAPSSFPEAAVEVDNDDIDPAINELVIEESPTNVTEANCNARLTSHCASFSGALTHLLKNTTVCNPTACFE